MAVFYSFHYGRDVHRVQLVRNIYAVESEPLLNAQAWEDVKRGGDTGIKHWIDQQMKYKTAVVVLIGAKTAGRKWIDYEIERAWDIKKPLLGIRIHGLASMSEGADRRGTDPFLILPSYAQIPVFDPTAATTQGTYNNLRDNLRNWVTKGVVRRW